jgi:streptomycin 6-kinase
MGSSPPTLDDALRRRLVGRYGDSVEPWLDKLPSTLVALADRWRLEFRGLIPRGSMSVVIRCTMANGQPGVLKICPDRQRVVTEADALCKWNTQHVPALHSVDTVLGALLMEAIAPGTMLVESRSYPASAIGDLLESLHSHGDPDPAYPSLQERIAYLFDAAARYRNQHPELLEIVPDKLLARGLRLAAKLAVQASTRVLLHGDLTPVNVLDGGTPRGLVAIDPAPCLGDPAFDAVDLLFWKAADVATVVARADDLAQRMGLLKSRLLDWCVAFAGMIASELAGTPNTSPALVRTALTLAGGGRQ